MVPNSGKNHVSYHNISYLCWEISSRLIYDFFIHVACLYLYMGKSFLWRLIYSWENHLYRWENHQTDEWENCGMTLDSRAAEVHGYRNRFFYWIAESMIWLIFPMRQSTTTGESIGNMFSFFLGSWNKSKCFNQGKGGFGPQMSASMWVEPANMLVSWNNMWV